MKMARNVLHGMLAGGLTVLLAGAVAMVAKLESQRESNREQQLLTSKAADLRAVLLNEMNSTLYLASGLVSYIQAKHGNISENEVKPWLQSMTRQARMIRNISLAPDNRISLIHPLPGNEAALGLYYPDIPEQWPSVQESIVSQTPLLVGPIHLKQGGVGLIYRTPVFLDDNLYWGMVSTVLDRDLLLTRTLEAANKLNLDVVLALNPAKQTSDFIHGDPALLAQASTSLDVPVPGARWLLAVSNRANAETMQNMHWLYGLGLLAALVIGLLFWLILNAADRRAAVQLALSESRQRFTQAFETAPTGMALITPEGRWLEINAQLCQLLDRTSSSLICTDFLQNLPEDQRQKAHESLAEARVHPVQWEATLLNSSGQPIDCHLSAAWLQGDSPSLILQCQDIRESKRLIRLKNEFVSTVSHELRTPLTSIAGALDLVAGGALGEVPQPMRSMLEIARQNSQRLSLLINDLLDMEKLNAGKVRVELSSQSLREQLQDAIASNSSYAVPLGVSYRLQESTDVHVEVDALRLQQVLSNLLSNAAKFAPRGTEVTLSWECADEHVRVSVSDLGSGIPLEFHERIFSKFSQADSSDQREQGGTGLGLAISKKLIELMHGRIGFISEPGAGTTFWFELPVLAPQSADAATPAHLLIVEDDDEVAELLKALLDNNGYANSRASSLEAARRQLSQENITGLILDLHLPDGHGASLLREIRQDPSGTGLPVIILSAFCSEGRRLLADLPGPIDWLEKPLHAGELLHRLRLRLQQQEQRPRILHVEDDADIRAVIAAQAASLADFDGAASLAEARQQLLNQTYQLLLLDIELPDGSGLDLLHEVQCTQPELPVIILSTNELSAAQLQSAQAAITKSRYSQTELLNLLRQHLNNQTGNIDAQP